jgi:hypothetical protein
MTPSVTERSKMIKDHSYLTLFHSSNWELGLAMSWRVITLAEIEESGGHIIIQTEVDEAEELFELYESLYCTSFKSYPFRSQTIYFDPLYNRIGEIRDRIHKDLKQTLVNKKADQFQM